MAKAKKEIKQEVKTTPKKITIPVSKSKIILGLALIVIVLLVFKFKGVFIAATVNGQPISRVQVLQELEKEGGKSVLDNMIINNLILQEAQKEKVVITDTEINDQIKKYSDKFKSQGQDLNAALKAQGMNQNDLKLQIKLQLLVQKMAGKGITVTDQEAQDYFKQNPTAYPKGAKYADVAAEIKDTLQQQKIGTAENDWVTALKAKAKINYFVSY